MRGKAIERFGVVVGLAFFLFFGAWAFLAPRSFFEVVAPWRPFNAHLLRDAGAFSVGIGLGLLAALAAPRLGALAAAAGGATFHALSHLIDYGRGGRSSDPWTLGALAILLLAALWHRWRSAS